MWQFFFDSLLQTLVKCNGKIKKNWAIYHSRRWKMNKIKFKNFYAALNPVWFKQKKVKFAWWIQIDDFQIYSADFDLFSTLPFLVCLIHLNLKEKHIKNRQKEIFHKKNFPSFHFIFSLIHSNQRFRKISTLILLFPITYTQKFH